MEEKRQTAPQYFRWTSVDLDPSYREHQINENHSTVSPAKFSVDRPSALLSSLVWIQVVVPLLTRDIWVSFFGLTSATVHQGLIDGLRDREKWARPNAQ